MEGKSFSQSERFFNVYLSINCSDGISGPNGSDLENILITNL